MQQSKDYKTHNSKKTQNSSGIVRIIGGDMRGRKLRFSTVDGLRPTLDRVRETLFNWLARDIHGSRCLDLFAGSGALGFEALSRGAKEITLVEQSPIVAKNLIKNRQLFDAPGIKVINTEALSFLSSNKQVFDIIFLDPPFGKGHLNQVLAELPPYLSRNGVVYIEQENTEQESIEQKSIEEESNEQKNNKIDLLLADNWQQLKFKKSNHFSYALYRYIGTKSEDSST